jgi:hypothetical protein
LRRERWYAACFDLSSEQTMTTKTPRWPTLIAILLGLGSVAGAENVDWSAYIDKNPSQPMPVASPTPAPAPVAAAEPAAKQAKPKPAKVATKAKAKPAKVKARRK